MRILLVNRSLFARSGTEIYLRDLSQELLDRGHDLFVFTPSSGSVGDELETWGIPVFTDPADLPTEPPEVIHAHHTWETLAVAARYPTSPMVFVGHDMTAWHDTPPRLSQIRKYVAVDLALEKRFVGRHQLDPRNVSVIPNPIDFSRFPPRTPLPQIPRRALLLSNYAGPRERDEIAAACDERGIRLDAVGLNFGNRTEDPGSLFADYDIVFGKGRCGLEAAQAGCAVVFCDTWGCGPLLSSELLHRNDGVFPGRTQLTDPLSRETIRDRLSSYDPADAAKVAGIIRHTYDSRRVVSCFEELYRTIVEEASGIRAEASAADLARELSWWSIHWEGELTTALAASQRLAASEAIEDRPPPRTVSFEQTFRCKGWDRVERDSHGPFRWMSPSPEAWIELTVPEKFSHFEFTIAHAITTSILAELRVSIRDHLLKLDFFQSDDGIRVEARFPDALSLTAGESERVLFAVPRTIMPAELDPAKAETRPLGIALRRAGFTEPPPLHQF